jgi:hypothetical protein
MSRRSQRDLEFFIFVGVPGGGRGGLQLLLKHGIHLLIMACHVFQIVTVQWQAAVAHDFSILSSDVPRAAPPNYPVFVHKKWNFQCLGKKKILQYSR